MDTMSMSKEFFLKVGETANIKRSFLGTSYSVIYAGMPNEAVYSVVVTSAAGYHAIAYNLFLPAELTRVELPKGYLMVHKANSEEIRFSVGY
jgi:hypothetical protein